MRTHAIGLCVVALAAGCGAGADATEKQLAELRAELVKLRTDRAMLSERLDALERSRGQGPAAAPRPAAEPDRPELSVLRLDPEDREPAAALQGAAPDPPDDLQPEGARAVLRSTRGGDVILDAPHATGPAKTPALYPPPRRTP
jgi:hypothetical protein